MRRILALLPSVLLLTCQATASDDFAIVAPKKLAVVASTFTDLRARVQLVPSGGAPGELHVLEPGDNGTTFSGFVPADPGQYTAEVVFSGVATSEHLFLGRWASDAFEIVRGAVTEVDFTGPLDTIGRAEDNGDPDADGLGIRDEIIWGGDLALADTDGEGVLDGADCDPDDPTRDFVIVGTHPPQS